MGKTATILRASSVMAGVSVLAVGVTFAALQTTATLTDNTLSSATASLLVDGPDVDTDGTSSEAGFNFSALVPGGDWSDAQQFSLSNAGGSDMQVTVYASGGEQTGVINKNKVHVKITNTGAAATPAVPGDETPTTPGDETPGDENSKEYTLAELESLYNNLPGVTGEGNVLDGIMGDATVGETNEFDVQVKLDADAISSGAASLDGFNLTFTGSAVGASTPTTPPTEEPGDEEPGDETPGDETPGDETPGDETPTTPGDETPPAETPPAETPAP